MKQLAFILTIAIFAIAAVPASAQTGPTLLGDLCSRIADGKNYSIQHDRNGAHLMDVGTGTEVFSLYPENAQTLTISGVVGNLNGLSVEAKERVLEHIALFNFSSPVGTLSVDQATGQVTMKHHLNSQLVAVENMARVAGLFGEVIRAESRLIAAR